MTPANDAVVPTPGVLPELDEQDPRRYRMNMDWVWSSEHNRGLRKKATVRVTVSTPDTAQFQDLFQTWAAHLHGPSDDMTWVHGGWFCQRESIDQDRVVLLFGSGGQDVAESLDYGIQWFSGAVLGGLREATVTWEELPLT